MYSNTLNKSGLVKLSCLFLLLWALTACGGGGDAGGDTPDGAGAGQNTDGNTNTDTNIKNGDEIDYAVPAVPVGDPVTGLSITNTTGSEQTDVPVTFGQVFAPGALPAGTPIMVRDVTSGVLPTQVDAKASHGDGSLRHAVITARLPSLTANEKRDIEIVVVDEAPTGTAPDLNELLKTVFDATVNLTIGGVVYTASAKDQLAAKSNFKTWLEGEQVAEWTTAAPLKKQFDGSAHPHLTARFHVRTYRSFDRVRVDVVLENNWAYVASPGNITYDATVKVCNNTIYSKTGLLHYHHARWRKTGWCTDVTVTRPQIHIAHDAAYLMSTGAIPNYDQNLTIPEVELAKMATTWTGEKIKPMGIGTVHDKMPDTGGRPDIGPLPRWAARYLLSQDPRAKTAMLGNANLAGSWSIHYRDQITDLPISLLNYPSMTIQGGDSDFPACDCSSPYTPDTAHQPSLTYLPYMITGDYYLLEELQFWAAFNAFRPASQNHEGKGLFQQEQVRGQAWSLRTAGHAAYITPDDHDLKAYFNSIVKNNIDYYDARYSNNASAPKLGFVTNGAAIKNGKPVGVISPWNDDALTMVVDWLVGLGFDYAKDFRDWKVQFVLGRFTSPDFCRHDAAVYRYTVQDAFDRSAPVFDTWLDIMSATFPTDIDSCPAGYNKGAHPSCSECYLSITHGALSAAKAAGYNVAADVFNEVKADQVAAGADFDITPQWAIVPR